jgi:Chaperone of endosialidase
MSYLSSNPYVLNLVPIFNVANSPTGGTTATSLSGAVNSLQGLLNTGNNTLSIDVIEPKSSGGVVIINAQLDVVGSLNVNGYPLGADLDGTTSLVGSNIFISSSATTISSILVEGQSYFQNAVYVSSAVSATAFNTVSDERLKANIQPLTGALSTVCQLQGVHYTMGGQAQIGLLAQQVQSVVPEAVSASGDGYLAVDYSRLVPLLIEAIKEIALRN